MSHRSLRAALITLELFVGVNALYGGVGLLAGKLGVQREWLANTPFQDFTVPAILLTVVVGGACFLAGLMTAIGRVAGAEASILAGCVTTGWIVIEMFLMPASWLQPVIGLLGLTLVALGSLLLATFLPRRRNSLRDEISP